MLSVHLTRFLELKIKTIILAGGLGTRISEETSDKPKPMVLIGNKPILWHVMSVFANQGFKEFVIAGGYKIDVLRKWVSILNSPWSVEILDTGENDQTGSRIIQSVSHIGDEQCFVTYGDGLGNINLNNLLRFHNQHKAPLTITAVRPPSRFGVLESRNGIVTHFGEKNQADAGWINGGFFVVESEIGKIEYSKDTSFEVDIIPKLVANQKVSAFHHSGFWQPMDTLREKLILEEFSTKIPPPWLSHEL